MRGHISRPTYGEARQAPDRQMFFVNRRPCGLPQVARAFNDVYKAHSVAQAQTPFILADLQMDTRMFFFSSSSTPKSQKALLLTLPTWPMKNEWLLSKNETFIVWFEVFFFFVYYRILRC